MKKKLLHKDRDILQEMLSLALDTRDFFYSKNKAGLIFSPGTLLYNKVANAKLFIVDLNNLFPSLRNIKKKLTPLVKIFFAPTKVIFAQKTYWQIGVKFFFKVPYFISLLLLILEPFFHPQANKSPRLRKPKKIFLNCPQPYYFI